MKTCDIMVKNILANILLSYFLLIQGLVFQVSQPNIILCFGKDGHIAFELQNEEDHCIRANNVSEIVFGQAGMLNHGVHDNGCTDVDLHFHPASANKTHRESQSSDIAMVSSSSSLTAVISTAPAESRNFQLYPASGQVLASVQATVLLI